MDCKVFFFGVHLNQKETFQVAVNQLQTLIDAELSKNKASLSIPVTSWGILDATTFQSERLGTTFRRGITRFMN